MLGYFQCISQYRQVQAKGRNLPSLIIQHIFKQLSTLMITSSHLPQSHSLTAQLNQFDLYPQKLIRTDQNLLKVEKALSDLVSSSSYQHRLFYPQVFKNYQYVGERDPLLNKKVGSLNHVFSEGPSIENQIAKSSAKDEMLIRWAAQDEIDRLRIEQILHTTALYQQKLIQLKQIHKVWNFASKAETNKRFFGQQTRCLAEEKREKCKQLEQNSNFQSIQNDDRPEKNSLSIQRVFQIEKYYYRSKQVDRQTYHQTTSKLVPLNQINRLNIAGGAGEYSMNSTQHQKFTRMFPPELIKTIQGFSCIKVYPDQDSEEESNSSQANGKEANSSLCAEVMREDEILGLMRRLAEMVQLESKKQVELSSKRKEKVERLFDVIRSMIINFKISQKSMEKIINIKEQSDVSKTKYMHLREYLRALYKVLEQETTIKNDAPNRSSRFLKDNSETFSALPLYENHEQKVEKLSSELSKVRMELDFRRKQLEDLKMAIADQGHLAESPKQMIRLDSMQPGTETDNGYNLSLELEQYKRKCLQYEAQASRTGKKKTQKVIFIRK